MLAKVNHTFIFWCIWQPSTVVSFPRSFELFIYFMILSLFFPPVLLRYIYWDTFIGGHHAFLHTLEQHCPLGAICLTKSPLEQKPCHQLHAIAELRTFPKSSKSTGKCLYPLAYRAKCPCREWGRLLLDSVLCLSRPYEVSPQRLQLFICQSYFRHTSHF